MTERRTLSVRSPVICDRGLARNHLVVWALGFVPLTCVLFLFRDSTPKGGLAYFLVVLTPLGLGGAAVGWLMARSAELTPEGVRDGGSKLLRWEDLTVVRSRPFLGVITLTDSYGQKLTFPNRGRETTRQTLLRYLLSKAPKDVERQVPLISF